MATHVIKKPYLSVGGTNISAWIKSVTLSYSSSTHDFTAGGMETLANRTGLKNWSIAAELFQDYDAGAIDATIFPLVGADEFDVEFRPRTDPVSATNPKYTAKAILGEGYDVFSGGPDNPNMTNINLIPGHTSGSNDLTRATS